MFKSNRVENMRVLLLIMMIYQSMLFKYIYYGIVLIYILKHRLHELVKLSNKELGNMIISLSIQLHEQNCSNALLRDALMETKNQNEKEKKTLRKQQQDKLKTQKAELEEVVRRHQSFIDQVSYTSSENYKKNIKYKQKPKYI